MRYFTSSRLIEGYEPYMEVLRSCPFIKASGLAWLDSDLAPIKNLQYPSFAVSFNFRDAISRVSTQPVL